MPLSGLWFPSAAELTWPLSTLTLALAGGAPPCLIVVFILHSESAKFFELELGLSSFSRDLQVGPGPPAASVRKWDMRSLIERPSMRLYQPTFTRRDSPLSRARQALPVKKVILVPVTVTAVTVPTSW